MSLPASPAPVLTRSAVFHQAWPIILAGASVPLLGVVDTAVIGQVGSTVQLAALALGTLLFNFLLWSFGFLRMATTGFVARQAGAGNGTAVMALVLRSLLTALLIGAVLLLLHGPASTLFLAGMDAGPVVGSAAREFIAARIWGAPAALCLFALCGVLIGLGQGRSLLLVQIVLNGLNALLDVLLAGVLGWGVAGIGWGTVVAEWVACALALWCVRRAVTGAFPGHWQWPGLAVLLERKAMLRLWSANADLLVRTVCLLAGFAWFARLGGQQGEAVLAANHLLLQWVAVCAFFLDGFAHVAEARVGQAIGAGNRQALLRAVRLTSELALITALLLGAGLWMAGSWLAGLMTDLVPVRSVVISALPLASLYVVLSVAAFQLDGVFIGATDTRAMRNAIVLALAGFVLVSLPAVAWAGNTGLWVAMVAYGVLRALALLPAFRRLMRLPGLAQS